MGKSSARPDAAIQASTEEHWRADMAQLTRLVLKLGAARAREMLEAVAADPASPAADRSKAKRILEQHPPSANGGEN